MNQITVKPINVDDQTLDVGRLSSKSQELVISTQPEYELASDLLKQVKSRYKELESQRKEITKPLDNAKASVMELFKKPLDILSKAEATIKRTMIGYTEEQERLAREEQIRLQREAEAEAERERKKLEARIERAKNNGKDEKAEQLEELKESIEVAPPPVVAPKIETPKGVSYKDKYTVEIIDFAKLPDEYKLPNQSALDKVAQATKGTIQIPGTKIHCEKILAARI